MAKKVGRGGGRREEGGAGESGMVCAWEMEKNAWRLLVDRGCVDLWETVFVFEFVWVCMQ